MEIKLIFAVALCFLVQLTVSQPSAQPTTSVAPSGYTTPFNLITDTKFFRFNRIQWRYVPPTLSVKWLPGSKSLYRARLLVYCYDNARQFFKGVYNVSSAVRQSPEPVGLSSLDLPPGMTCSGILRGKYPFNTKRPNSKVYYPAKGQFFQT